LLSSSILALQYHDHFSGQFEFEHFFPCFPFLVSHA
jgi:hypothetical protein